MVESVKQSKAEPWKTSIQTCGKLDILFSLSISCSQCLYTISFPDAQAEVFPLMKRMEFFKLKSLIKNKVFHPFTITLWVQLPFSALFTMEALIIKGITVGHCCHWKYRNENRGERIDMSSSTVVSILCKCFSLTQWQAGTYHMGTALSALWNILTLSLNCYGHVEWDSNLEICCSLPNFGITLGGYFCLDFKPDQNWR